MCCLYDEESTMVCIKGKLGYRGVARHDATSGRKLWELTTHNAWHRSDRRRHGIIYGKLRHQALILNARTGEDRPDRLPNSPDLFHEYL